MKKTFIAGFILLMILGGCSGQDEAENNKATIVGSDKDVHGCIGSAGYSWCERTEKCERPWELAKQDGFNNTMKDFEKYCLSQNASDKEVHTTHSKNISESKMKSSSEIAKSFTGKVVYLPFEGGFWGIITDDNKKLNGSIPKQLKIEGLRISGSYQTLSDVGSYQMWGKAVKLVKLEKE